MLKTFNQTSLKVTHLFLLGLRCRGKTAKGGELRDDVSWFRSLCRLTENVHLEYIMIDPLEVCLEIELINLTKEPHLQFMSDIS